MRNDARLLTLVLILIVRVDVARAQAAAPGEWPMWRRDRRLTGHQPMPGAITRPRIAWKYDLAAWEGLVVVRPGEKAQSTLVLGNTQPVEPGYLARTEQQWGIAQPRYNLSGDGKLVPFGHRYDTKIGKLLPDVAGLQKVHIAWGKNVFGEQTDAGTAYLYSYQRGADKPTLVWQKPTARKTHRPHVLLADIDGDGDADVVHSDWGQLSAYDGQTGEQIRRVKWLDRRHRGVVVAEDIDGDGLAEVAVLGHFHMNVSVVGNDGKRFHVLWAREYEDKIEVQDRIVRAPRRCLTDLDGDGTHELAYSVIDLTTDARWRVVVHNAVTGEVLVDSPGKYLDDIIQLDEKGPPELMLSDSGGLALPAVRTLTVASLVDGQLVSRWRTHGRLHQQFDQRRRANETGQLPFYDTVAGDVNGDGRPEFFVSNCDESTKQCLEMNARLSMQAVGEIQPIQNFEACKHIQAPRSLSCTPFGFDADGNVRARQWSLEWPPEADVDVLAVNAVAGEVLVRCRVSSAETAMKAAGASLDLVSWRRKVAPGTLGTPIVADLDGKGAPTILVPRQWDRIAALQPEALGGPPKPRWQLRGRGMSLIYDQKHYGVLAANLDDTAGSHVVFATEGTDSGAACLVAVRGDGAAVWRHELREIQWSPTRGWGPGAVRTWSVGSFRHNSSPDVYVSAHLNAMHSGVSRLLDGRNGTVVWRRTCLKGRVKEAGGGMVSVADLDGDGLEEIAGGYCNYIFTLRGNTGEVRSASHSASLFHPVMPGSWVNSTTPLLLEVDGRTAMLIGRQPLVTAMVDDRAIRRLWWRNPGGSLPGVADVDGDGRFEIGIAGGSAKGEDNALLCLDPASGEVKWELPLPDGQTTDFAACDVDGDGLSEFVFVTATTLYAVNGKNGQGHLVWQFRLPTATAAPVVADVDADRQSEILIIAADGYLYCVDQSSGGSY